MAARPHRTETVEPAGVAPAVPDEPSAPTRLVVQRGLFFGPSALVPEDLYAVVSRGGARRERHRVVLDPHSEALVVLIVRWALWHGPRAEDPLHLEAEIEVELTGGVLVHDEQPSEDR